MSAHGDQEVLKSGDRLSAEKAVVMIHGRGATAHSILQLEKKLPEAYYVAPQAANNTWYPYSFMSPLKDNQPELDAALNVLHNVLEDLRTDFEQEDIVFLGFSQGACLVSEYVARNPGTYGGLVVLSGGLIGGGLRDYDGDMEGTRVFIGCGDDDPHIPLDRVDETAEVFEDLGSEVDKYIFEGSFHGIDDYEIERASEIISSEQVRE